MEAVSPAATGHPGLPLELIELPLGCFSTQMGPAGGDPPPSAAATPPPFPLPAAPSQSHSTAAGCVQSLWEFQTGVDHRDDSASPRSLYVAQQAVWRGQRSFLLAPDGGGWASRIPVSLPHLHLSPDISHVWERKGRHRNTEPFDVSPWNWKTCPVCALLRLLCSN